MASSSKLLSPISSQLFDNAGNPLAGGTITVYKAGTLTLAQIYANAGGGALSNPVTLNAAGRVPNGSIFFDAGLAYDVEVKQGTTVLESLEGVVGLPNISTSLVGATLVDEFVGDGIKSTFTLSEDPVAVSNLTVIVDGLILRSTVDYSLTDKLLSFVVVPASGAQISARYPRTFASEVPASALRNKLVDTFTTTAGVLPYTLSKAPGSVSNTTVSLNGLVLTPGVDYTLLGAVLTLAADPGVKDLVVQYNDTMAVASDSTDAITYPTTGQYLTKYLDNNRVANVKDFGAVGDGIANDSFAIQQAINSGANLVFYPKGTYLISTPLNLVSFQKHLGVGDGSQLISSGVIFTHTTIQQFVIFESLTFNGTGTALSQTNKSVYSVNFEITRCSFSRSLTDCLVFTPLLCKVTRNQFGSPKGTQNVNHRHIYAAALATGGTAVNANYFSDNRFNNAGTSAQNSIYLEYGSDNVFERNDIEGNNCTQAAVRLNAVGVSSFRGNWFESNTGTWQVYADDSGYQTFTLYYNRVLNFDGNHFVLLMAGNAYVFWLDVNSKNVSFDNNILITNQAGVKVTNSAAGDNVGIQSFLGTKVASGTWTLTGIQYLNTTSVTSTNVTAGATSTSTAKLVAKDSTLSFQCVDASDVNLFYVGAGGQISTGASTNSPYNSTTASAANVVVLSNGILQRSTSSLKYKTDVSDMVHGLPEVLALRPVTYRGKNDGTRVFGGLVAEEVHEAGLTEFVQYAEDGSPDALHYANMVSLLVKAIQQLKQELDLLKG